VGPLLDTSLHKLAHALFEMLRLPVLGRKEDAADQVSAYIMLQLGKVEARRLIGGVACAYKTEAGAATPPPTMTHFADLHGTPAQRFYNVLCIAYGADKQLFGDIVEKGYLPKERAEDCKDEYQQVAYAYEKLIGPHADRGRAKKYLTRVGCSRRDNNGAHIRISGGCKSEFFLLLRCDGVGPESHGSAQHFEKDSS
jgi:Putative metallopeptidase